MRRLILIIVSLAACLAVFDVPASAATSMTEVPNGFGKTAVKPGIINVSGDGSSMFAGVGNVRHHYTLRSRIPHLRWTSYGQNTATAKGRSWVKEDPSFGIDCPASKVWRAALSSQPIASRFASPGHAGECLPG